jgi:hypothetical protein
MFTEKPLSLIILSSLTGSTISIADNIPVPSGSAKG